MYSSKVFIPSYARKIATWEDKRKSILCSSKLYLFFYESCVSKATNCQISVFRVLKLLPLNVYFTESHSLYTLKPSLVFIPQVQAVIELMGLRHVAESRIGGVMIRGVSGGEKRRISIALQLLKDPGMKPVV